MQFHEVTASAILPGKSEAANFSKEEIEKFILDKISKTDRSLYDLYLKSCVKTPKALKTFLLNLEEHLKSKCIDDKQRAAIKNIFETIKLQFNVLENLNLKDTTNNEIVVLLFATALSYFDAFLLD